MKLKRGVLKFVKKRYSDIAFLRQKHKLLVVIEENAGENNLKSQEVIDFFETVRVNGSQELLQYFTRAIAEWNSVSGNQFCNDISDPSCSFLPVSERAFLYQSISVCI